MQSHNYVPGVSGWKLYENGNLELDGTIRSGPAKGEVVKAEPKPFIVVDGVTYISEAEVDSAFVSKAKIESMWSVKVELRNGKCFAAGIGVGEGPDLSDFEKAKEGGLDELINYISKAVSSSQLAKDLVAAINAGDGELASALTAAGRARLKEIYGRGACSCGLTGSRLNK